MDAESLSGSQEEEEGGKESQAAGSDGDASLANHHSQILVSFRVFACLLASVMAGHGHTWSTNWDE